MFRFASLIFTGLLVGAGCSRGPETGNPKGLPPQEVRTYPLTGQVLAVRPETNEILVKHEDIVG
ncbi:MAG: hypothetical protein Q8L75_20890, partial [Acidobacteriota bacterium]|nr:hypothetical protein [Acidobacteriota bacterium]